MPTSNRFDETIPSELDAAERIQDRIIALVEQHGFTARDVFGMRLALEEAIVNAIKHGNRMDPDKSVQIHCEVDDARAFVRVEDEGPGFNPTDIPDPTAEENLEKPGGRGIMLMRAFMTRVEYVGDGNIVELEKRRDASEPEPES